MYETPTFLNKFWILKAALVISQVAVNTISRYYRCWIIYKLLGTFQRRRTESHHPRPKLPYEETFYAVDTLLCTTQALLLSRFMKGKEMGWNMPSCAWLPRC